MLRTGRPEGATAAPIKILGEALVWMHQHLPYVGDDCLIWPFGKRGVEGYGAVHFRGRTDLAHRVMCILAHGEPPAPNLDAAHSCGNGFGGCVHPQHVRWATRRENVEDEILHGTIARGERNARTILTADQVIEIRGRLPTCTHRELAEQFGVSIATIGAIKVRRNWAWLGQPSA